MSQPTVIDTLPPDQATRDRIRTQLDKNFLVEAAAGTGKTTNIVDRMVALIATGTCRIDQLAAVTFTRKAGAELRERFQAQLLSSWMKLDLSDNSADRATVQRLRAAADGWSQAFMGTIHSFCATLLRERPIEFGIDPAFTELDEGDEAQLREQAWQCNIQDLIASNDPLIIQLNELGIDRGKLHQCFHRFVDFRDVQDWPCDPPSDIDLEQLKSQTAAYIDHMRSLIPHFKPASERATDQMMNRYEEIVRRSNRAWERDSAFFDLLERFDSSLTPVQKYWHSRSVAVDERDRWSAFRSACVRPGLNYWCNYRYRFLVAFLRRAVDVYVQLKRGAGGLDFQDLLLTAKRGLQNQPALRSYFQGRFTHLLVDEFQDTDPIQAEMMLYLTSSDVHQTDWTLCTPRPGALFVVGDPKQSIYRFRRGDIVTYNQVKEIFRRTGGEVLALVTNFRSRADLIAWNNSVYRSKFGNTATDYSPAAEDMQPGLATAVEPAADKAVAGLYRLELPTDLKINEVREIEADAIARWIRYALDQQLEVPRSQRDLDRGATTTIQARDILVIPWRKANIDYYTSALEQYGIAFEVAGGNPLQANDGLQALVQCLRAIDDPYHPVHYLSLLRGFFGFSDRELYQYKLANGPFVFTLPVPEELDEPLRLRFNAVTNRLRRYQAWMRAYPYMAAVERIAEDLGLFAASAACPEGNVRAGGLFKAIERLRHQNWDFDSATDLIQTLEEVLAAEESDGCTALAPDANVVRVMNLHKAKGLEAPIVFLADVSAVWNGEIQAHIDRRSGISRGFIGIAEDKEGHRQGQRQIASPVGWEQLQAEENQFLQAEHERLLYVSTTRAAAAMIVSVAKPNSNWGSLYKHLSNARVLQIPDDVALATAKAHSAGRQTSSDSSSATARSEQISLDDLAQADACHETIGSRWRTALQPSFAVVTAKKVGLRGRSRPKWEASGDYGYQWGSAVHELLEVRHKLPQADLRANGLRIVAEYHLGSQRLDELLATVEAVTRSAIWQRAQRAAACFSELPIETLETDAGGHRQLVRGVIDLIFQDENGWVIVDYKTDDISIENLPEAVAYYRAQLEEYAKHWLATTGKTVTELGLYFTRINRYAPVNK